MSTLSFGGRNSTNCFFSNLSPRFRCVTSPKYPGPNSYLGFYFNICEWCILSARASTPALMLHLTNPCAKRKVLSLTKPKGKIYKTKSLRNYITNQINVYFNCYCISFHEIQSFFEFLVSVINHYYINSLHLFWDSFEWFCRDAKYFFPFLSKALWSRINSCYGILFSKSTENDIDTRLTKAWTAIDGLSIIWKSDLTDKMKRSFFQAVGVSILLYGCTTWMLTKPLEKKLDGNYTRMLWAILNKSWWQHPIRHQLYGHLPPISKTIQLRRTSNARHCWRSRDKLISDVLLWTPTYGRAKAGLPARTYIQQLWRYGM